MVLQITKKDLKKVLIQLKNIQNNDDKQKATKGAEAGYSDGTKGLKPQSDNDILMDKDKGPAYQAAYKQAYDKAKATYDQSYNLGANAGRLDGQNGKDQASGLSQQPQGYQDGYNSQYSQAKANYDQDYKTGKSAGAQDGLAHKPISDLSNSSTGYKDGYLQSYAHSNSVYARGQDDGLNNRKSSSSDPSYQAGYQAGNETYQNGYQRGANQALSDIKNNVPDRRTGEILIPQESVFLNKINKNEQTMMLTKKNAC
ncbi:hypothetical protein [Holzapfeliella floricola]|uniref:hypothetical protein n=1 Tax=Holzapfeliella floricola TaxID=679249 RepID=UPI000782CEB4|nr:hypothetical protein [Holzapfeliella floricola]